MNRHHESTIAQYRAGRRAFIAACAAAGADSIARVHPQPGPDGKPLFCDSATFGARGAQSGLALISAGADAAALLAALAAPPEDVRLVLVHALDPFAAAWGEPGKPRNWPAQTLTAIATEDLSRVRALSAFFIGTAPGVRRALARALAGAEIRWRTVTAQEALPLVRAFASTWVSHS